MNRNKKLRKAIITVGEEEGQVVWVHALQSVGSLDEGVEPHVIVEYLDGHMDFWGVRYIKFLENPSE